MLAARKLLVYAVYLSTHEKLEKFVYIDSDKQLFLKLVCTESVLIYIYLHIYIYIAASIYQPKNHLAISPFSFPGGEEEAQKFWSVLGLCLCSMTRGICPRHAKPCHCLRVRHVFLSNACFCLLTPHLSFSLLSPFPTVSGVLSFTFFFQKKKNNNHIWKFIELWLFCCFTLILKRFIRWLNQSQKPLSFNT